MAKKTTKRVKKSVKHAKSVIVDTGHLSDKVWTTSLSYSRPTTLREHMAFEFAKARVQKEGLTCVSSYRHNLVSAAVAMADALLAELAKPRKGKR